MSAIFTPTTSDKSYPLMLVSGHVPHVTSKYISSIKDDFSLIILRNPNSFSGQKNIFQVYDTAVGTIRELKDKLEYAVFFITSQEDKDVVEKLLPKLERDKPETLVLIPVNELGKYYDIILALKHVPSVRFGILGELFGQNINPDASRSSAVVYNAKVRNIAYFTGDDLISVFPISINDSIKAIQYLLFSHQDKFRVNFLFYEHPQTIISAIHLIKKELTDLQIDYNGKYPEFSSHQTHKDIEAVINSKTHLKGQYIDDVLDGFESSVRKTEYIHKISHKQSKPSRKTYNKILEGKKSQAKTVFTLFTISFLLFLVINAALILSGVVLAKNSFNSLEKGSFSKAHEQLSLANNLVSVAQPLLNISFSIISTTNLPLSDSYNTFIKGMSISKLATAELDKMNRLDKGLSEDELLESIANINYLYFTTQSSPSISRLPYMDKFSASPTGKILSLTSVMPDLLGYRSEKTYLLLFQNNGELRPTGGFIGSIGELVIDKGVVKTFEIHDVYNIDGQIKNHTEPPFIVRRFLQPHLYLRDSNFYPDFQQTSTTSASLYKESVNKDVNGVIAVDYEVLRSIIAATGPLYLPSHDRSIDSESGFEFIQSTIEDNFFPGSSQKKDLLNEIWGQLTIKLQDPKNSIAIASLLPKLVEEKHIQFSIQDPVIQEVFSSLSYAGELINIDDQVKDSLNDYFALNEANIGVNKANMHVSRAVTVTQDLSPDELLSNATVKFENTGNEDYKAYMRLLVPASSSFEQLLLDDKEQETVAAVTNPRVYESNNFQAPQEIEFVEEALGDKKSFGFVITIPKRSKRTYSIKYSRDISLPDTGFTYNFIYQTQPGTTGYPFTSRINYQPHLIANEINQGTISKGYTITQFPSIKQDQKVSIMFIPR